MSITDVSPEAFPPTIVITAEQEMLEPDALEFAENLEAAGNRVVLHGYPWQIHAFTVMLRHREGAESVRLVVDFLNEAIREATPAIPVTDRRARRADVPQTIGELFAFDTLLRDDEKAIVDTVRDFGNKRLRPNIADWFDAGSLPVRELAVELGALGLFGMQLEGYGCAGASATAYGLACQEMEAVDSGLRSFVSVQGSLAMFAIWKFGSDEQKDSWLPEMSAGRAIGCFGLTEPDFGSNPAGMRTNAKRDGSDWILNGAKMWIQFARRRRCGGVGPH